MLYKGFIFKNKKFDDKKLLNYGFIKKAGLFSYEANFLNDEFKIIIKIKNNSLDTKVIENSTNEEYNLIYVKSAQGEFIGKAKAAFEDILIDIKNNCTLDNIFKTKQAYEIIKYLDKKYETKAEYLWEKFPNNAIFRKDKKWYAAILTTKKESLGLKEKGEIEVINLKEEPLIIEKTLDNKNYFKAWHMNKKHWYTIILDDGIKTDEIFKRIDKSYELV